MELFFRVYKLRLLTDKEHKGVEMVFERISGNAILLLLISMAPLCYADSDTTIGNGLRITSDDGQHKFHLGGYLLFDAQVIDETENGLERFDLFNAWVHIVGSAYDLYDYKIQYSLEDSSATKLRDAYISYRLRPRFKLRIGQYDMPTIAEHMSALSYTTLSGRAIVDSLTPGRDVGVEVESVSVDKNWHYSLGLFNGNGIDANGEDNGNKDIAGRVTGLIYQSQRADTTRLYLDLSFTQGKQVSDNFRFRSESGEIMLAATDVPIDDRMRLAGGIYTYHGSSSLKAVYLENSYELGGQTGHATAWSILLAHLLTGEQEAYQSGRFQKIIPKQNYNKGRGGAWQIALRYSQWQANAALVQASTMATTPVVVADKAKAISVGINWILNPNARINASWIRTEFDTLGASLSKDTEDNVLARFTLQFF